MAARKQKPSGSDLSEPDEPTDKPKVSDRQSDKPKARRKPKPISENPAASLSLLARARRR